MLVCPAPKLLERFHRTSEKRQVFLKAAMQYVVALWLEINPASMYAVYTSSHGGSSSRRVEMSYRKDEEVLLRVESGATGTLVK